MQWEVSANRLLTASRAGHHRAAQLGSHLVASGVTLAPFGSQLSASFMIRLNRAVSSSGVVQRPMGGTVIDRAEMIAKKHSNLVF